jgi:hypothetical protein
MSGEEAMVLGHIQASANEGEFYVSNRILNGKIYLISCNE